jgi:CBS domain-containing protein
MSSSSTLLNVVNTHTAEDVLKFTAEKKAKQALKQHHDTPATEEQPAVIVIDSKMTPLEASQILWSKDIMGAPVYNAETKTYVGMFDVRDILSCVISAHREYLAMMGRHKPGEDTAIPHDIDAHRKAQGELIAKALQNIKINTTPPSPGAITVSYLAARNPMKGHAKEESLVEICKELEKRGTHRVGIMDNSSGSPVCTGIISQSGLVDFIFSKCPPCSLEEKICDAGIPYKKEVAMINEEATAADAFELLDSKRLSGIAVVDEDGVLIGNTSARDIKHAVIDGGKISMDMDVISYLAQVRQNQIRKNERFPSCHVYEDATVGHVVGVLAKTGYHRVFVVDTDKKPIGVVSFADVLRWMLGDK